MKTGVIIARFQTPYLHKGHHSLIQKVIEAHNRVIIVLGVSPIISTKNNPFDFFTREKLIKQSYPNVYVLPLANTPSDKVWSDNLDNLLYSTFPGSQFVLYGSRDSFIPYYLGKNETIELKAVSYTHLTLPTIA